MDDITPRYTPPRRNYGGIPQQPPHHKPAAHHQPIESHQTEDLPPVEPIQTQPHPAAHQPHHQAHHPQPTHQPHHQSQPHHQAHHQPQHYQQAHFQTQHQPHQQAQPDFEQPAYDQPRQHVQPAPAKEKSRFRFLSSKFVIAAAAVLILLAAGAFYFLKPEKTKAVTVADLAKQANFSLYYPNPLPQGYVYNEKLGVYQDNHAYYLFSNGNKHIIVREQASTMPALDTKSLDKPEAFDTGVGKAAIGSTSGQTAALVQAGSTLITIHSNGSVPPDDVRAAIDSLRIVDK